MSDKKLNFLMDNKLIRILNVIQEAGVFVFGLGSVALVSWFVLCRYLLRVDFPAFDELISVAIFWFYYLGGAKASYDRVHIQADVVEIISNKRVVAFLKLIGSLISLVVLAYLLYLSYSFAAWNASIGTKTLILKFPMCISQFSIFVGSVFMFIFDLLHFIQDIAEFAAGGNKKSAPASSSEEAE